MVARSEYDVVLLPTFSQVEAYRKRLAAEGRQGLFACEVTTFAAWIADLWELYGDGRRLVDSVQRFTIMHAACQRVYQEDALTPGIPTLAARCVSKAAGLSAFEQALDEAAYDEGPQNVHPSERLFLAAMARYREMLVGLELVELGQACARLSANAPEVFTRPISVLMANAAPLDWMQQQFFESCPQVHLVHELAPGGEGVVRMPEHLRLRFAFPAGAYAQPGLVADIIREQAWEGGVVVTCADPFDMYKQLEEALTHEGIEACVQAQVKFGQTDFGRTMLSLASCLEEDSFDAGVLSDVILSPFSGISQNDAYDFDKQLRGNRLADRDEWLQRLCVCSDEFSRLEEIARDPEACIMLGAVEQRAMALPGRSQEWRSEQLAAIGGMRAVMEAARLVHLDVKECHKVLEDVVIVVSYAGRLADSANEKLQVIFTTQAVAATLDAGSCSLLVAADLTTDAYPIADRDDAATTLMEKLGYQRTDMALARARRTFRALQGLPQTDVVLMRPLNDANAEPAYSAVVLEELIDTYRADPTATDDIDKTFHLPESLRRNMLQRGEEALYANAHAANVGDAQPQAATVEEPAVSALLPSDVSKVVLARRTSTGEVLPKPCPSPSQIERYLECPQRWFVEQRLSPEQLDEQFSPLERGTFVHEAMEAFYRQFQQAGYLKVLPENLAEAQEIMRGVLANLVEDNYSREPHKRYVPRTQLEMFELENLCNSLVRYLSFEAQLLPTFHPAYLEYQISTDNPVEYARRLLTGKVDRIDIDDAGRAVIIDYKGSLDAEYELAGKTPEHVGKVQTRIYAQAVKRILGLNVVGALYVSYSQNTLKGAVDIGIEAAHLPGVKPEKLRCGTLGIEEAATLEPAQLEYSSFTFDAMLDLTEQRVAQALTSMERGDVAPNPLTSDVCKNCPVSRCQKRGA